MCTHIDYIYVHMCRTHIQQYIYIYISTKICLSVSMYANVHVYIYIHLWRHICPCDSIDRQHQSCPDTKTNFNLLIAVSETLKMHRSPAGVVAEQHLLAAAIHPQSKVAMMAPHPFAGQHLLSVSRDSRRLPMLVDQEWKIEMIHSGTRSIIQVE